MDLGAFFRPMADSISQAGKYMNAPVIFDWNTAAALAGMVASLAGSGLITDAQQEALGEMTATIYVNQSEATVQQIVDAVWNALATEYDLSGTMGEKLNGAGSAGDPWTTDLTSYTTANTAGKILKERLSKGQFLGLK